MAFDAKTKIQEDQAEKRTFVKFDVKIKRGSLRLIKWENLMSWDKLSIIEKKSKLHSVIHSYVCKNTWKYEFPIISNLSIVVRVLNVLVFAHSPKSKTEFLRFTWNLSILRKRTDSCCISVFSGYNKKKKWPSYVFKLCSQVTLRVGWFSPA